jgi:hypothetical protein
VTHASSLQANITSVCLLTAFKRFFSFSNKKYCFLWYRISFSFPGEDVIKVTALNARNSNLFLYYRLCWRLWDERSTFFFFFGWKDGFEKTLLGTCIGVNKSVFRFP